MTIYIPQLSPTHWRKRGQGGAIPWYLSGGVTAAQCMAAWQAKGAASLADSYINLNNPGTYNLAPGTAPTHDPLTGWTFDGATQWLTSGAFLLNGLINWSVVINATLSGAAGTKYGICSEGAAGAADLLFYETNREYNRVGGAATNLTYDSPRGSRKTFILIHSAAGFILYIDGVNSASGAGHAAGFTSTTNHYQLRVATGSSAITYYRYGVFVADAVYNITLSPAQVTAITTAVGAL